MAVSTYSARRFCKASDTNSPGRPAFCAIIYSSVLSLARRQVEKVYNEIFDFAELRKSVRTEGFIRRVPVLGFLAWWAFSIVKAPSRIAELFHAIAGLTQETRSVNDGLRQEVRDLGAQLTQQVDATCNRLVREALRAAGSYTGPKAREGLWFNEPIAVQQDDNGHPFWPANNERINGRRHSQSVN